MSFSPLPCYLVPHRTEYLPEHPVLIQPQSLFLPQFGGPSFTPIQTTGIFLDSKLVDKRFCPDNSKHFLKLIFLMKEIVICFMIPLGLNFMCRRFGTIFSIFIGPMNTTYKDGTERLFRKVAIYNSDAGELPKKKECKIHNTVKV